MSIDQSIAFDQLILQRLARATERGLGDLQVRSNLDLRRFDRVSYMSARNLLIKASRALAAGDRERATRYDDRATALPFDDNKQANPVVFEAHMHLYKVVADAADTSAVNCTCWLDAAESCSPPVVSTRARTCCRPWPLWTRSIASNPRNIAGCDGWWPTPSRATSGDDAWTTTGPPKLR
jgi:hypothetical protein